MAERRVQVEVAARVDQFRDAMQRVEAEGVEALRKVQSAQREASATADTTGKTVDRLARAYAAVLTPAQKTAMRLAQLRQEMESFKGETLELARAYEQGLISQLERRVESRSLSQLIADISTLSGPASRAAGALSSMTSEAAELVSALGPGGAAVAALTAGIAGAGAALVSMSNRLSDTVFQLDQAAKFGGTSAIEMSRFRALVRTLEIDVGDLAEGLNQLTQMQIDALSGSRDMIERFRDLGITLAQLEGPLRSKAALLAAMADGVAKATDHERALAAASQLLGDDLARKLAPAFAEGAEGIARLLQKNEDLALTLRNDTITAMQEYRRATADVDLAAESLGDTLGTVLAPVLTRLKEVSAAAMVALRDMITPEAPQRAKTWSDELQRTLDMSPQLARSLADVGGGIRISTTATVQMTQAQRDAIVAMRELLAEQRGAALEGVEAVHARRDAELLSLAHTLKAARETNATSIELERLAAQVRVQIHRNAEVEITRIREEEAEKRAQEEERAAKEAARLTEQRLREEERAAQQRAEFAFAIHQRQLELNRGIVRDTIESARLAEESRRRQLEATTHAIDAITSMSASAAQAGVNVARALAAQGVLSSREAARVAKAMAVFQALLQIPLAISTTFAQAPGGVVAKGIQAGIAGGIAAANAAAVVATPLPTFEAGGPVYGARHFRGGVHAELEGGEHVLDRRDVRALGGHRAIEAMRHSAQQGGPPAPVFVTLYNGWAYRDALLDRLRLDMSVRSAVLGVATTTGLRRP